MSVQEYNNSPLVAFVSSRLLFLIASAQPKPKPEIQSSGYMLPSSVRTLESSPKQSDRSEIELRYAGIAKGKLGLGSQEPTPNSVEFLSARKGRGGKPIPRGVGFFAKGFIAAPVRSPPGEVEGAVGRGRRRPACRVRGDLGSSG